MDNWASLTQELKLRPAQGDWFIGRLRGFPVGLKFIGQAGSSLLLFQIRHPLPADAKQLSELHYDKQVAELLADKKMEIEFEDRMAWLTVHDGANRLQDGSVAGLLDAVLRSFELGGLAANLDLCHYCRRTKVEVLTCHEGRLAQICPACLQERISSRSNVRADATAGAFPLFFLCPVASLVGAIAWALVWIGHDWLFNLLNTKIVVVPRIAELVVLFCIAFLAGGPVGWVIKHIPKRGSSLSVSAALIFGSLAVAFGEVLYLVWLIYKAVKVVSFSAAVRAMPAYYLHNDVLYLVIKALAALASLAVAYGLAKPDKQIGRAHV